MLYVRTHVRFIRWHCFVSFIWLLVPRRPSNEFLTGGDKGATDRALDVVCCHSGRDPRGSPTCPYTSSLARSSHRLSRSIFFPSLFLRRRFEGSIPGPCAQGVPAVPGSRARAGIVAFFFFVYQRVRDKGVGKTRTKKTRLRISRLTMFRALRSIPHLGNAI